MDEESCGPAMVLVLAGILGDEWNQQDLRLQLGFQLLPGLQRLDLFNQPIDVSNPPIHGSESHIRHIIDLTQAFNNPIPDRAAVDRRIPAFEHRPLDVLGHLFERRSGHRAPLACANHPRQDFIPIERFTASIPFGNENYRTFGAFECGKSAVTGFAFPSPANPITVFNRSGVENFGFL
jgi:hypothetical protein